jgi:hypothetical protein
MVIQGAGVFHTLNILLTAHPSHLVHHACSLYQYGWTVVSVLYLHAGKSQGSSVCEETVFIQKKFSSASEFFHAQNQS